MICIGSFVFHDDSHACEVPDPGQNISRIAVERNLHDQEISSAFAEDMRILDFHFLRHLIEDGTSGQKFVGALHKYSRASFRENSAQAAQARYISEGSFPPLTIPPRLDSTR